MAKETVAVKKDAEIVAIRVRLRAHIIKEKPGMYVSYCPALDLCSQGATAKEAEKNIVEATELFLEGCAEQNMLEEILHNCGFYSAGKKAPHRRKTPPPDGRAFDFPAEIPLTARC